jgi:hypothetical protein
MSQEDTTPVDRGDELPEDINPEDPDQELAAQAAEEKLKAELDEEKDEEEVEAKPKKDARIPLSRHKEILEKERAIRAELEAKYAKSQQGGQLADFNEQITATENSIMKMEKEYAALLTDGEIDKATALMSQIRRAEREMNEAKSDMKIHAAEVRNTERARYNIALERVELAFPTLNPDHEDYDEEAMAEVADLKSAYEMKGLTPTQALQKAVKMIVEPRTTKQEVATTSSPRVGEKDVAAERKAAAVKKTVEAVAKTPPNLSKNGLDSDKAGGGALDAKSVMKMSQAEFAKLNPETLAQMRGDTI